MGGRHAATTGILTVPRFREQRWLYKAEKILFSRRACVSASARQSRGKRLPGRRNLFSLSATSKKVHKKVAFIPGRSRVRAYLHPR